MYIRRYPAISLLTSAIIIIQLFTYVYGNGPTDIETARNFGAIQDTDINPKEWFRLTTYLFVQIGGVFHLLANLSCLIILGPTIERIYGSAKFILLFFITGLFGGLFIILFSENVVAAGASGSIFGLMGIYLGLIIQKNKMIDYYSKSVIYSTVLGNILYTFAMPNISIAAHLGGLFGGFIFSFLIRPQSFKRLSKTTLTQAYIHIIIVTLFWFLFLLLPNYINGTPLLNKVTNATEQLKALDIPFFNSKDATSFSNEESEKTQPNEQSLQDAQINNDLTVLEEPQLKILQVHSGISEGWIDISNEFYDEVSLTIQIENWTEETIDITPAMFILSDSEGNTPSQLSNNFNLIPLAPMQQVTIELVYAVSLKTTSGDFLLSVSNWNSFGQFNIDYQNL